MKRLFRKWLGASSSPVSSPTPSAAPGSKGTGESGDGGSIKSLEKQLIRHYRGELKSSLNANDVRKHAEVAEKLIALGDGDGHHAKLRFIRNRGETHTRLLKLAEQTYAADPSPKSALLLAGLRLDNHLREGVEELIRQVAGKGHPNTAPLELRWTFETEGREAASRLFGELFQAPHLTDEARGRLFHMATKLLPAEAREAGLALLRSSPVPAPQLLREMGAHFFTLKDFGELRDTVKLLEPISPYDALYLENLLRAHEDSRPATWREGFARVEKAAAGGDTEAVRLSPFFWNQGVAEAIKYIDSDEELLALVEAYFKARSYHPTDLDLAIGVIRRLAKGDHARVARFVALLRERLWDRRVPEDWLGNSLLQTGKLTDVLWNLGLFETFISGLDLEIVPHAEGWRTAYEFATPRACGVANAGIVQDHLALQHYLSQVSAGTFFDVRVSAEERTRLMAILERAVRERRPFSIVRICDGEAYGFPRLPDIREDQHDDDLRVREIHWWGRSIPESLRVHIQQGFLEAIRGADLLGIPNAFRLVRDVDSSGSSLLGMRTARSIVSVVRNLADECASGRLDPVKAMFTDERFHHLLFSSLDDLGPCFEAADRIVVVSCYSRELVLSRLSFAEKAHTIHIPPHTMTASLSDYGRKNVILPEIIDSLIADLQAITAPGTLVLVAAGFAGKMFLQAARDRGGVALDIGVALDYWLGLKTRSHVDLV